VGWTAGARCEDAHWDEQLPLVVLEINVLKFPKPSLGKPKKRSEFAGSFDVPLLRPNNMLSGNRSFFGANAQAF
jgi:hypothetical protein